MHFKANRDLPRAAEGSNRPTTPRPGTATNGRRGGPATWSTSVKREPTAPHLLTHVHTTTAAVHEAQCTAPIQHALVEKGLPPSEHLVDAAYIDAELLVSSYKDDGITLRGPARPNPNWQAKVEGAYTPDFGSIGSVSRCTVRREAAASWAERVDATGRRTFRCAFVRRTAELVACGRSAHRRRRPPGA